MVIQEISSGDCVAASCDPPLGIASLRAASPLLELRLFEPRSPEGALKKIKEKRFPAGTALKAK